jgi:hypothetical protein
MQEDLSRLLGLEGFEVERVVDRTGAASPTSRSSWPRAQARSCRRGSGRFGASGGACLSVCAAVERYLRSLSEPRREVIEGSRRRPGRARGPRRS